MGASGRTRVFATIAGAVTLGLGLGIRAAFAGWFGKYAGVALWATLVYFLILWVAPKRPVRQVLVLCVAISFAVELAQLTPGPLALYRIHPLFALVFGTTFNFWDLPAYVVGAGVGAVVHEGRSARMNHRGHGVHGVHGR